MCNLAFYGRCAKALSTGQKIVVTQEEIDTLPVSHILRLECIFLLRNRGMRLPLTAIIVLAVVTVSTLVAEDEVVRLAAAPVVPTKVDPQLIAELASLIDHDLLWRTEFTLPAIRRLLKENPGAEEEFIPLVLPLFDHCGYGGIGREDSEEAEALIVAIGQSALPLMDLQLLSTDARRRRVALQVLFKVGPRDANLVRLVRPMLTDKDDNVRGVILDGFKQMGSTAKDAVADLEQVAAKDLRLFWRVHALVALIHIDGVSKERMQALADLAVLKSPCDSANRSAISAIGELGEQAQFLEPLLIAALQRPDVRDCAAQALAKIKAQSPEAVAQLIELLNNETRHEARRSLVAVVGEFGPRSQAAIPTLKAILATRPDEGGWYLVADALSQIGGPEVVPILIESLSHPNDDVRLASIRGLGHLGKVATPAIAALEKATLEDERPLNRPEAVKALAAIRAAGNNN